MRRSLLTLLAVFVFLISPVLASAASAAPGDVFASATRSLGAVITEDFAFLGCPFEPSPTLFTCGTAVTTVGRANVATVLEEFTPVSPTCFRDRHTSTLTFVDGSTLVVAITGTLCSPAGPPNFTLTGTYVVTGGTGRFSGSSGHGSVAAARRDGPIHLVLAGTLT
jgi:hypothetical protein